MATTVFQIEGGVGKHIAATAVIKAYKKAHPKRKIVVVCAFPEIFLRNKDVARHYRLGMVPYFYEDYIYKKDVQIYAQDPYRQTNHIIKKSHLVETWCDMVGVPYNNEATEISFNFREKEVGAATINALIPKNNKPVLIFQPFGGPGKDHQPHPYAWTRDLHPSVAQAVVDKLKDKYNILHICYEFHPHLKDCIRFDGMISKKELFSMLSWSEKRLFIDSSLQHAAAAMRLPSIVTWVATKPEQFGYPLHNNLRPSKEFPRGLVDSYLYDYNFTGTIHECPYDAPEDIYDADTIVDAVLA
tara:strand:+ start:1432 stop:2331 length:900 start_codon:yes stop_codon:yes gene_type:complete